LLAFPTLLPHLCQLARSSPRALDRGIFTDWQRVFDPRAIQQPRFGYSTRITDGEVTV